MEPLGEGLETAYLGLGANLANRQEALAQALRLLNENQHIQVMKCSAIYETEPWGFKDQPNFLNCVAQISTTNPPALLLEVVKRIERDMGRVDGIRYGPRIIDIDILLYGNAIINLSDPDLQIPHSRIMERAFVLVPLAEIAGSVHHPVNKKQISDLAEQVQGKRGVVPWGSAGKVYPAN